MNFEKYIGIPYVEKGRDEKIGLDCWGLVRLIYKNELSIDLPSFSTEYDSIDNERIEDLFAQYKEGWEPIDQPTIGDVVIFRVFGYESHIGICVGDNKFIHVREARDTVIESLDNPKWSKRITGFFKYSEKKNAVLNTIPHPLRTERYTLAVVPGTTVSELVTNISLQYNVAIELKSRISILINGIVIPQENWNTTLVKQGDVIEYRAVPGKSALRTLALLAVVYFAPMLAGYAEFAAMPYMASTAASAAVYTAAYAGTILIGSALINAIAPIRPPVQTQPNDPGSAERQLMVSGGANRTNPYGSIPVVLGKVRMTPLLGSNNFLTYENERDSYLSMLLVWGYGPLNIDDTTYKIGEVPLSSFTDVTKITLDRKTEPTTNEKINFDAIYGKDVTTVNTAIELTCDGNPESTVTPGPWFEAASAETVNTVTLALHFPQGLRKIYIKGSSSGNSAATSVNFRAEYSIDSGGTWSLLEAFTIGGDSAKKDGFTYAKTFGGLNYSQMIVRVRRETGDNTEDNDSLRYYFTSILQNVTFSNNSAPALDPVGAKIAKTAFKIKASEQLNGGIQSISAVVQTWCKIWNGSAWVDGATSNPAALMRYVLEHPANPRKITDASTQINLTQLQYFYNYCATKGFEYNGVLGESRSILEVIRDICAAGRASPALVDGKWTVVIDEAKSNIVQHFTPHNSWGFEGSKALPKRPDGLRVTYYDQDQDYQEAEIIVYDTGKDSNTASLFESITLPGVTKKSLVIDHARWHMAQMKLRPEVYTLNSDIEYLVCNRGDRVKVMHDVPMWGLGSGRIKDIYNNLTTYSEELNTNWTNSTGATWQYSSALSPENTLTALGVDGLNGTGISATGTTLYQVVSGLTIGKTYTFSAYIRTKTGTHTGARLRMNQTGNSVIGAIVTVNETWQRISVTATATSATSFTCVVGTSGIANLYIWGAMLNEGTVAQPYVKSTAVKGCSLLLDEEVTMQANIAYTMRFRSKAGVSSVRTIIAKTTDGYYDKVDLTSPVTTTEADVLDLFLFGQLDQESQDLMVLSIEPTTNNSARLVMVDYGVTSTYNIFTDYLNLSSGTVFESQITLPPTLQISGFGTKVPNITGFVSDESVMERIAKGIFKYNINVSYFNASDLPNETESVEVQYDFLSSTTSVNNRSVFVPFQKGSATISDVQEGETYKVRMRYIARNGKVGNWGVYANHTVVGKISLPSQVTEFAVTADKSSGQLLLSWHNNLEPDVSTYEIRTEDAGWGVQDYRRIFYGDTTKIYTKYGVSGFSTFYIRAVDSAGNYSSDSSVISFIPASVPNIADIEYSYADTALTSATVTLSWSDVTTSEFDVAYYELTYGTTTLTVKANSITVPADWVGNRTFTVKTVDIHNNKSSGYSEVIAKITPSPPYDLKTQVIDNTVMLFWTLPTRTSLPIDHVLVKKGSTWATASVIGDKKGAFTTITENTGGQFTYWLAAVDTENIESTPVSITTTVGEAPGFVFYAEFNSAFTGTKSSAAYDGSILALPINTTETFQQHFTTRSWTTPQDQVTAGYPIFIQPTTTSGYYEEVFDFGQPLASSRVLLTYVGNTIAGTASVVPKISLSLDNSTYVDYNGVTDIFGLNFRYVKIRITVTSAPTTIGLYEISKISVRLDSKLKDDAGSVSALSTDTLGTIVNFNKEFIDVQSINLSPSGTTPIVPVYDFKDNFVSGTYSITSGIATVSITAHGMITGQKVKLFINSGLGIAGIYTITGYTTDTFTVAMVASNTTGNCSMYPQSFRVYSFNNSGSRVTSTVSWAIKGY